MAGVPVTLEDRLLFFEETGGRDRRPVVAIAAPSNARQLLNSRDWIDRPGQLAIQAVKQQLETHSDNSRQAAQQPQRPITTLFDATTHKIGTLLEQDPSNMEAVTSLFSPTLAQAAWSWPSLPYNVLRALQSRYYSSELETKRVHAQRDKENKDVDAWILQNEDYLQSRLTKPDSDWTFGLVSLDNCNEVFFGSTLTLGYREITRRAVDGFKCLDRKRASAVHIQANNQEYKRVFHKMTNGQLEGLDWSNIFVAGGMTLGALLCVETPNTSQSAEQWISSDIDIYIYGLGPEAANKKIEELWTIFKRNIPPDSPTLVIRNSKTVSFLSNYPLRRFQIILKIVRNPAEVLLNFDLDICAMGFNGEGLYMLPRAARALETGYNVFTMDMVQGHYLGTRRASQEQRVFKYANRGYGIRFLKSYTDALKKIDLKDLLPEADTRRPWQLPREPKPPYDPLDMDAKVIIARDYFDRLFQAYMSWSNNGKRLSPHYVGSTRGLMGFTKWKGSSLRPITDKPIFTHALMDTLAQKTSEPLRRSCLTGFELFYRHVALWEAEQDGKLHIQADVWSSTTYEDVVCRASYEELPNYAWDQSFSTEEFHQRISLFNTGHNEWMESNLKTMAQFHSDLFPRDLVNRFQVQRIISGSTLQQVQGAELTIPIWMPQDFVEYAQHIVQEVVQDHAGLDIGQVFEVVWTPQHSGVDVPLVLVIFRLSPIGVYQQFDRRLDEIYEAAWSFMHSNSVMEASDWDRAKMLRRQFSRRALRHKPEGELKDFACWVRRDPGSICGVEYGAMGQGFWVEVEGERDE